MSEVIAEIGLNHDGDLDVAKELIRQSKISGCWGVKFQYRNVDTYYKRRDEVSDQIIHDEIKRNFISVEDLFDLSQFCNDLKINFGVSIFRVCDLEDLDELLPSISFLKVPSAECLNKQLIEALLKRKRKIFVSTGAHETHRVLNALKKYKNEIILLHCISNYPSILGTQDLAVIKQFKDSGFLGVGYSSHDEEWEVCLIALAQGAQWIERHITLQKKGNGLDHSSSSTLDEFVKLVRFSKEFKHIVGSGNHSPNQGELINLQNLGTALYAKRNLKRGQKSKIQDYEIKAPRVGISPGEYFEMFEEKEIADNLHRGQPLTIRNFSTDQKELGKRIKDFAKSKKLGIPVRLHDYLFLKKKFDLGTYEFHLSFTEALSGDFKRAVKEIDADENISIHLPDYIPGNNLLDPISRNSEIRTASRKLIANIISFAAEIENKIMKKVNIIGSFSKCHTASRKMNLEEVFEYISSTRATILPQWLPVYAWYFGGSVKLDLFNSFEDIEYLTMNDLKICLDVSHLVMAASYYNASWKTWYKELLPIVEHVHISDAADMTSEGLMFGEGLIGDFTNILTFHKLKIIECWQGHMNSGEGFQKSLEILYGQADRINV